jgi:hypothetical protein
LASESDSQRPTLVVIALRYLRIVKQMRTAVNVPTYRIESSGNHTQEDGNGDDKEETDTEARTSALGFDAKV